MMNDAIVPEIGGLATGGLFLLLAVLLVRHRAPLLLAFFSGESAVGTVVGIDRSRRARVRLRIAFTASSGRRVEYIEPMAVRGTVGDSLQVRYNKNDPACATSSSLLPIIREFIAFVSLFGIGGLAVAGGSLYGLVADDRRMFYGASASSIAFVTGLIFAYVALHTVSGMRAWRRMAEAQGRVVRNVTPAGGAQESVLSQIEFATADGRKVEYADPVLTGRSQGEEVTVYYDPESPEFTSTTLDGRGLLARAALYGLIALMFTILGCWAVWFELIRAT